MHFIFIITFLFSNYLVWFGGKYVFTQAITLRILKRTAEFLGQYNCAVCLTLI